VVDTTPPVIVCPPDVTIDCLDSTDPSNTGEAGADDNCGAATIAHSDSVVIQTDSIEILCATRTIKRTWTATDECGNASSCVQTITVVDNTPPEIICPADVTVECDQPTGPGATGSATAIDDCSGPALISHNDVVEPGNCPQEKNILRTWTATDACGNASNCVQTITVVDTTPPVLSGCPDDATVECDSVFPCLKRRHRATARRNTPSSARGRRPMPAATPPPAARPSRWSTRPRR